MKKILVLLALLLVITLVRAENSKALGIALGPVSGGGISFRKFQAEKGYEFNYIGFGDNNSFTIILGGKYIKEINSTSSSRFYYFGGASLLSEFSKDQSENSYVNVGAGVGFEYSIREQLRVSLDLPLSFINLFPKKGDDTIITTLIPEIGIRYYF